jgi:putative endonuclease
MKEKQFYIYIMTNPTNTVTYVGVTSNLTERISHHKAKVGPGFTSRYNINKLVYYEVYSDAYSAISREKQLKGGSRERKVELIKSKNPLWEDLSETLG